MIVAVDGPSASGKSTVARAVADRLGLPYLDTGSMYRAVAWAVLQRGTDVHDAEACGEVARSVTLTILGPGRIAVDGVDVSDAIRTPPVTAAASQVAVHPELRRALVDQQRAYVGADGAVVEGRDIGTVVFPQADLKVFLVADAEERARRREAEAAGHDLESRDRRDAERATSPTEAAPDAIVIDTTGRSPDEVVDAVLARVPR